MNEIIEKVPWMVTLGTVAVNTIIINLLFLAVFFKTATLERMRTSLLLINLTAADLIVGAVAIPMYMAVLWPGSEATNSKALRRSYDAIDVLSSFASLFGLAVIALERVYSVFWPYRHRSLSNAPYFVASLASWFLAAATASLILLRDEQLITSEKCFYFIFSCMIAVLIIITVSYSALWIKIKTNKNDVVHQRRIIRERKLAKTLTILTGVFLITWLPFYAANAVFNLCQHCGYSHTQLIYAIKFLHYSNSLANPVVYSLRCPRVRMTLAKMFRGS